MTIRLELPRRYRVQLEALLHNGRAFEYRASGVHGVNAAPARYPAISAEKSLLPDHLFTRPGYRVKRRATILSFHLRKLIGVSCSLGFRCSAAAIP